METVDYHDVPEDCLFRAYEWKQPVHDKPGVIEKAYRIYGLVSPSHPGAISLFVRYNEFDAEWVPILPQYQELPPLPEDHVSRSYCCRARARLSPGNPQYAAVLAHVHQNNAQAVRKYRTHDNGDRPFLAYITPETSSG